MPGMVIARVLPESAGIFDTAIPTTKGEVVAVNGCYDELIPGTIIHFQGGVTHKDGYEEYRVLPQGKILFYEPKKVYVRVSPIDGGQFIGLVIHEEKHFFVVEPISDPGGRHRWSKKVCEIINEPIGEPTV